MPKIEINKDNCKGCFLCIEFCPKKAIRKDTKLNRYGVNPAKFIDNGTCIGCGHCLLVCPEGCIKLDKSS